MCGCVSRSTNYLPKRTYLACGSINDCVWSIQSAIIDNWTRPKSARTHFKVEVELSVGSRYEVTSARVVKSSGIAEYDQSALDAVNAASPFIELSGLSDEEFNKFFSEFTLVFDPIDLKN